MQKILFPNAGLAIAQGRTLRCALTASSMLLAGCGGIQSALSPEGPAARSIANISWAMFIGATIILLIVMVLALYAVYRTPVERRSISESKMVVIGGIIWPVVTLSVLLAYGVYQMGDLRSEDAEDTIRIEVVGNQWWWDVYYRGSNGQADVVTANEIRIPAGVPISVLVRTNDVIHSFWVPNLAGKIDMVPGRTNQVRMQADEPGIFRGQCAEFCGAQHARMAFFVIAEPRAAFDAWLAAQRQPAAVPATELAVRGRDAFTSRCLECHTVRGVGTADKRGPDLTHVGSRAFIGAGTLENNPENLLRFITNSQSVKPGSGMPEFTHLEKPTLAALVAYLEGLR
jgi:cytochrome c oxidase subunit II